MALACVESVRKELVQIKHLPPLNHTANRLLQLVGDDQVEIEELATTIEQDPGLAARIVGLANSAYFGQVNSINSVQAAIIRVLGLNMVKNLALGIAMAGVFNTCSCPSFKLTAYWHQALGTAALGRLLSQRSQAAGGVDPDSVYLCGLLNNIGVLLLAHAFPKQFSLALDQHADSAETTLRSLEQAALGIDHVEAGEWLALRWHLPPPVVDAMTWSDGDGYSGEFSLQMQIVDAAGCWVRSRMDSAQHAMTEDSKLSAIPGLDPDKLMQIEALFGAQFDGIGAMAQTLGT